MAGRPGPMSKLARERAAELLGERGMDMADITATLVYEGFDRDRARQAAAWVIRRARGISLKSGTAPNTSLHLTVDEREWLIENGGIQPVIKQLIAEARK